MDHSAARTSAVTAVLRRVVAVRAVHRLLLLAGLVVAGWLIGGAAQAFADTASHQGMATASPQGAAVVPASAAGLLRAPGGIVQGASAVLRGRAPVPAALAAVPHGRTVVPLPGHPVPNITPTPRPSVPPAQNIPGRATNGDRPGAEGEIVVTPAERPGRTAPARPSAITRRIAANGTGFAKAARAHVRRSASRTVWRGPDKPVAPVPAPAPAQATGASAPAAGPVLFGGFGGTLLRRSWTPRRPGAVLLRALNEVPPAVRGAADEPSFAPD
ncbi:hypothetical protein [Actinomadura oligospora]|uniref:hypothetical protein n=1 Tax=Actinomadura oligospora TaxID=111804 RepID=UPI0004790A11|nr:hypothetical protein [Actinomadura oligospora]